MKLDLHDEDVQTIIYAVAVLAESDQKWLAELRLPLEQRLAREGLSLKEEAVAVASKIEAQRDAHMRKRGNVRVGDRVEGGSGDDYDTGRVVAILAEPVGECDVVVAWDSGTSTPAVSAWLARVD